MEKEVKAMQQYVGCDASSVWLIEDDEIRPYIMYGSAYEKLEAVSLSMGSGICGYCIDHNEEIISNDLLNDTRWNQFVDQKTGFTTKNLMCLPITIEDEVYGCVELVNKREGKFTEDDVAYCKKMIQELIEYL